MNQIKQKDFYINAAISSKSKKFPGVLFIASCAEISLLGNRKFIYGENLYR